MTNTPVYKLITGAAAINSAIDSIHRRGKRLDKDIQIAALSAMQHHVECGDTTLINRLVDNMPTGSRINALREFIETFGAVRYDTETKKFVHVKGATFDLEGAMAVMWSSFKPDPVYTPIDDPMKLVSGLISKMENDMKKMGTESKVTPEMIAALKAAKAPVVLH